MLIMLPCLVLWSDIVMMFASGLYITSELGMTMGAFLDQTLLYTDVADLTHGLSKSAIFGVLITLVGMVNGASVQGGAEGVGRVTTSAVVQSISVIILTDLIFVFAATR